MLNSTEHELQLLINVKMPTLVGTYELKIVGILKLILSRKNVTFQYLTIHEQLSLHAHPS